MIVDVLQCMLGCMPSRNMVSRKAGSYIDTTRSFPNQETSKSSRISMWKVPPNVLLVSLNNQTTEVLQTT